MSAEPETCYRHPKVETRVHCTRCNRPICPDCMTPAPVGHHCPTCVAEGSRQMRRLRLRVGRRWSPTAVILGVNVALFVVEMALGGLGSLVRLGAMVPALVADGQYWRLLSAMFLHAGIAHLLLNSIGLWIFGNLIESTFGVVRFAAIYFVAGFCASAASFAFAAPGTVAVGASGAIFGLVGAWLAYNLRRRSSPLAQSNIQGALFLVAINLVLGVTLPGIDNTAHIGGLAAGVLAGLAAEGFGRRGVRRATQVAGLALVLLAGIALAAWRVDALTV